MTNFVSRVTVVAVALPAVLGLVWLGGWWLFVLLAAAGMAALHELYAMARPLRPVVIAGYAGLLLTLFGIELGGLRWGTGGLLSTLALAFLIKGIAETRQSATVTVGTTMLGVTWIGLGLGYMILIRGIPVHSRLAAFTVLLAVWGGDTAAYFFGRLAGRHKLAPVISPGKTWEGFVAGTIVTVLIPFFALYSDRKHFLPIWQEFALGAVIAVAAPMGDLFESAVKRDLQVKDSGRLLGGHGGVLDRVDALLFATIASFYALLGFGWA